MLEQQLAQHADRPLRIGSFSAASNVTGIVSDTHRIADLLHAHGALSFWDFAAAAPYVEIEMNRECAEHPQCHKDAVFLSPHKFIGGPGTPGVLVVRRELLTNRVPVVPGGGTVAYVNPLEHRYLADPAHREEGGTPAIIESIRAGLVFQLKQAVGADASGRARSTPAPRGRRPGAATRRIEILGNLDAERLSIVSFVVRRPAATAAGVPAPQLRRRRCSTTCSASSPAAAAPAPGPYGHRLLGIDLDRSHEFEREIAHGCEGIKPGWVRVNFNYFISEAVFDYVVEAVGWSPSTAGGCCPTTGSTRPPGCGATAAARSSRRCGSATSGTTATA